VQKIFLWPKTLSKSWKLVGRRLVDGSSRCQVLAASLWPPLDIIRKSQLTSCSGFPHLKSRHAESYSKLSENLHRCSKLMLRFLISHYHILPLISMPPFTSRLIINIIQSALLTATSNTVKVKQSRYRPGVAQRVPGS
jgi:hypothetical protein